MKRTYREVSQAYGVQCGDLNGTVIYMGIPSECCKREFNDASVMVKVSVASVMSTAVMTSRRHVVTCPAPPHLL